MPLVPVNAASTTTAKTVACGAVPDQIECCCTTQKCVFCQMMMLFVQQPALCSAPISRFRIPVPLQQQGMAGWLCGHTPLFFQGWASPLPQLDGASVLVPHLDRWLFWFSILAFVFLAFASFGHPPLFPQKSEVCSVYSFFSAVCVGP